MASVQQSINLEDDAMATAYGAATLVAAMRKSHFFTWFKKGNGDNTGNGGAGIIHPGPDESQTFSQRYVSSTDAATIGMKELIVDNPSNIHWDAVSGTIIRLGKSLAETKLESRKINVNVMRRITGTLRDWGALQFDIYANWMCMADRGALSEDADGATLSAALLSKTEMTTMLDLAHIGTHSASISAASDALTATGKAISALFAAGDAGSILDPAAGDFSTLNPTDNLFSTAFCDDLAQKCLEEGFVPFPMRVNEAGVKGEAEYLPFIVGPQVFGALRRDTMFMTDRRYATIRPIRDSGYKGIGRSAILISGLAITPVAHPKSGLEYGTVLSTDDAGNHHVRQVGYVLSEECMVTQVFQEPKIGAKEMDINHENTVVGTSMYLGGAKTLDFRPSTSSTAPDKRERVMIAAYCTPAKTAA